MLRTIGHRGARVLASVALEAGLVFGVLLVLSSLFGAMSVDAAKLASATDLNPLLMFGGLIFAGTLVTTPPQRLHGTIGFGRQLLVTALVCLGLGLAAFVACCLWTDTPWSASATMILAGAVTVPLVITGWRWSITHLGVFPAGAERVLVLGTGDTARQLSRWISERCLDEYRVSGFAARSSEELDSVVASGARVITVFDDLTSVASRVDRVIVALDEKRGVLPTNALMHLRLRGIVIEDAVSFLERTSGKIAVEKMLPSWLIYSDGFRVSRTRNAMKRFSDVVLSLGLLALAAPVMAITALAIRIDSRGRILFRQKRVGLGNREFELIKFRSMVEDAEASSGPVFAKAGDARVTRVGRFIRKTRIDELPQLINVLRGEMSFVGPRPERRHFIEQLEQQIPYFNLRLAVRPGITGWAQVSASYGATVEENLEKLRYDLFYIKNLGFFLDFWVVLKTIVVVLRGKGAR